MYHKLLAKVNNIDTSQFVLKTKYDANNSKLEKRTPDISRRFSKTDCNTKITAIENKIPSISGLATTCKLTAAENKKPISNLVKKKIIMKKLVKLKK